MSRKSHGGMGKKESWPYSTVTPAVELEPTWLQMNFLHLLSLPEDSMSHFHPPEPQRTSPSLCWADHKLPREMQESWWHSNLIWTQPQHLVGGYKFLYFLSLKYNAIAWWFIQKKKKGWIGVTILEGQGLLASSEVVHSIVWQKTGGTPIYMWLSGLCPLSYKANRILSRGILLNRFA